MIGLTSSSIARQAIYDASRQHPVIRNAIRHFAYASAWKKLEPMWNFVVINRMLSGMRPLLERLLTTSLESDPWGNSNGEQIPRFSGVRRT